MSSESEASEPDKPSIARVNEAYNDPDADVALISNDGARFHTQSFYLKAGSRLMRDVLVMPPPPPLEPTADGSKGSHGSQPLHEIPIDAEETVVKHFLDALHPDRLVMPRKWPLTREAMELTYFTDSPTARERLVWATMNNWEAAEAAGWYAFLAFAKAEQFQPAKFALGTVSPRRVMRVSTLDLDTAKRIPLPYLLGLVRGLAQHAVGTGTGPRVGLALGPGISSGETPWHLIAADYKLVV